MLDSCLKSQNSTIIHFIFLRDLQSLQRKVNSSSREVVPKQHVCYGECSLIMGGSETGRTCLFKEDLKIDATLSSAIKRILFFYLFPFIAFPAYA